MQWDIYHCMLEKPVFYEVYSYNDTSVRGMSGEYDSAHSSSTQVDSLASDTIIEYI